MGVDGLAVAVGEHPPVIVDPDCSELGGLQCLPSGEDRHGGGVEVDRPACVAGLAAGLVDVVADGDEPAVERERVLLEVDDSPHLRPRTSLRRIPVIAASHSSGNMRWPAAARKNCCKCWAVQDWASVFWLVFNLGDRAMSATLRVTSPRRTATSREPRMTRWTS